MKAQSFSTGADYKPIEYVIRDVRNDMDTEEVRPAFVIDPTSGVVTVKRTFDYDDPSQPRRYTMNGMLSLE